MGRERAGGGITNRPGKSPESEVEKQAKQRRNNKNNFSIPEGFEYPETFRTAERFDANIKALELLAELMDSVKKS